MTEEGYNDDVFNELDDEEEFMKRLQRKAKMAAKLKTKKPAIATEKKESKPKTKKLSKEVQAMQDRYDAIAALENATPDDWQEFFKSIEKFVMKHAYMVNFKRFIEKDSDLWGHLVRSLLDRIIPKKNPDGTRSCWYIDPDTLKVKVGYDPGKGSNIGNYLLSQTKWIVLHFNQFEMDFANSLVDVAADPIPDDRELKDDDIYTTLPDKIETRGDIQLYRKELEHVWDLRQLSV